VPSLIYQVVWQRVLTLYFGVDIYSTAVTVSIFMLGLGIGSLIGGHLADRMRRPAVGYAVVEGLTGLFGLASLGLLAAIGRMLAGAPLHVLIPVDFALLLIPTTLMGATLPLMVRAAAAERADIGPHIAALYGLNTLGAALGALASAYLLIGLWGFDGATNIAAALNIVLALLVLAAFGARRTDPRPEGEEGLDAPERRRLRPILALSFASGFIALGYQMVVYRLLTVLLKGTTYAFGTMLFVFLVGIAWGAMLARRRIDSEGAVRRFALSQLVVAAHVLSVAVLFGHLGHLPGIAHLIAASFFTSFHPDPGLVTLCRDGQKR
jgi:spermidine synthase